VGKDWQSLTHLTGDAGLVVERVRLSGTDVAIEGAFELPAMARLTAEDQVFVAAFVKCHGSIKQMESYFGVSYPTIKNRLNKIGARLPFVEIDPVPRANAGGILNRLERGEIDAQEALAELKANREGGSHE
jgi:hypothetical protein